MNPLRGLFPSGTSPIVFHPFRAYLGIPLRSKRTSLLMFFGSLTDGLRQEIEEIEYQIVSNLPVNLGKDILFNNQHYVKHY